MLLLFWFGVFAGGFVVVVVFGAGGGDDVGVVVVVVDVYIDGVAGVCVLVFWRGSCYKLFRLV